MLNRSVPLLFEKPRQLLNQTKQMYKNYTKAFRVPLAVPRYVPKIFLIMRLTIVILVATLMQVSAATLAQKVSLHKSNAPLKTVLQDIRNQCGYNFVIAESVLNESTPVSIAVQDAELKDVLNKIFADQPLSYSINRNTIIISEKEVSFFDKIKAAFANIDVHGRVVDENGNALAGASISVSGSSQTATTNTDGNFYISNVNNTAMIRISYVGYITREVKATADLARIILTISNSKLDEIKVIGYGTTTQRLATGNVATLSAADIAKQPVNNIFDAMIGRLPGMQITPTSGMPGAAPKFLIRGAASIANSGSGGLNVYNAPLFIIDGVPLLGASQALTNAGGIDNNALNLLLGINPADVESISVLKDADATAIYGAKGGNGVVLITTKRGRSIGTKVTVNAQTGIQQVAHFIDMLDVHQYNALRREALKNDNITPTVANAPDLMLWDTTATHNWQKEFLGKKASYYDLNLSVSGGSDRTHFFMSSALHREGSVMPGDSKMDRRSFFGSINHISDNRKFTFDLQTGYTTTDLNLLPQDLVGSIFLSPQNPMYTADGKPNFTSPAAFPLAYTMQKYAAPNKLFTGNVKMGYEPLKGLKLRVNAGYNYGTIRQSTQLPLASLDPAFYTSGSLAMQSIDNGSWIIEPQAEYDRRIKKHHLNIIGGLSFQRTTQNSINYNGSNFANDALVGNIGSAGTVTISSTERPQTFASTFGRISYDYNREFLANVSYRRDGSSRFGDNAKFANFGAVGLGWIFTQEKWVNKTLPFLSYGKLRASYGITGNDQINDFGYVATHASATGNSGYNGQAGLIASNLQNPDYSWETIHKSEGGLELGFLNDRFVFNASYFRNKSSNQLISYITSIQTGFYSYIANFDATTESKGYELELTSRNIRGKFSWSTNFNFSKSSSKLVSYPGIATSSYSNAYIVGQPLTVIQAYQQNGLTATGIPQYVDFDGIAGTGIKDRVVAGNKDPQYGGISNDFTYKGFSFSFFVQYARFTGTKPYLPNSVVGLVNKNYSTLVLGDHWQKPGDEAITSTPRYSTQAGLYNTGNYLSSVDNTITRNIFRLSNASLNYTFPTAISKHLAMSRLQLYINAQNLYVWDKYKKYELDPLTGNTSLPPLRTIVFGINATL